MQYLVRRADTDRIFDVLKSNYMSKMKEQQKEAKSKRSQDLNDDYDLYTVINESANDFQTYYDTQVYYDGKKVIFDNADTNLKPTDILLISNLGFKDIVEETLELFAKINYKYGKASDYFFAEINSECQDTLERKIDGELK